MKVMIILLSFYATNNVEEPLRVHVESFMHEASARGVNLPEIHGLTVKFKPLNGPGGLWDPADSTIWVNSVHRDTRYLVELIVFHELGHAWLGRSHDNERTSIMNAKPAHTLYKKYRKEYLDQLFLGTPVFR